MALFAEFKRRNVFKVGAAYLAVAWLLIQVSVSVEAPLSLPGWFDTMIIVLLAVGFPVALFLAWAYELTPEGIRVSGSGERHEASGNRSSPKLNYLIIGALSLAVVFLGADKYVFGSRTATRVTDELPDQLAQVPDSIAILPLEALAGDEDPVLSGGVYYELSRALDGLNRLSLIGSDTMQRYANSEKSNREIAAETGAQYVLDLKTLFAGDSVRISYELFDFGSGSGSGERPILSNSESALYPSAEPLAIHTSVARAIAERIIGELSPEAADRLGRTTQNPEAQAAYLTALGYLNAGQREDAVACLAPASRAVQLDANFAQAWLVKSYCHDIRQVNAGFLPETTAEAERAESIAAIERALAIDSDYAEAYRQLSFVMATGSQWRVAGESLEKARELGIDDGPQGALELASMGRLKDALESSRAAFERNRYAQVLASTYMLLREALDDRQGADDLYAVLSDLYGGWPGTEYNRRLILMGRVRDGLADPADLAVFRTQRGLQPEQIVRIEELLEMSDDRDRIETYLRAWAERAGANQFAYVDMAAWAAYYDFPELALRYLRTAADDFGIHLSNIWAPLYRDVRRLDEFEDYMREIGMVDEWIAHGWPERCEQDNGREFHCV